MSIGHVLLIVKKTKGNFTFDFIVYSTIFTILKKKSMKKTFLFATLLFASLFATAQNTQKLFRQEYGVAQSSVYDNGHSLVKYKGSGFQFRIGNERDKTKNFAQFENTFAWIPLNSTVKNANYAHGATEINDRMGFTYLRKLAKTADKSFKIAVGGTAFFDLNYREYGSIAAGKSNNVFSWDINLGLQAVGRVTRDFAFKNRSFSASYQLGLPVLAYNHRPSYLGIPPIEANFEGKDNPGANWNSLGRVTTINSKYFYLNQQINLDKINANGNRIRLSYTWNYSNNGFASHRYQNIISGISIGVLTNFSKNKTNI
jgi:hypothetical protein